MFNTLFYLLFILYEEFLYKYIINVSFDTSFFSFLFLSIGVGLLFSLISNLIPKKVNKTLFHIFNFLICFYYGASIIVKKTFDTNISLNVLSLSKNFTGNFTGLTFSVLANSINIIILVIIPFVLGVLLRNKLENNFSYKTFLCLLLSYVLFLVSLNTNTYNLYFNKYNNNQNVLNFGVMPSLFIDSYKYLTGFKESVEVNEEEVIEETPTYERQIDESIDLDIKSNDETINNLNDYIKSQSGTYTNEYTGLFEGKNLIYIMAESFDGYMVNEELTPTLYKLIHNGFYFSNYYSPTNLSTIGGEFSLLTGLLPDLQCLNTQWIQDNNGYVNYFPYGLGTLFKDKGYSTFAYHDYLYDFQSRDKYLSSLGFDNYEACYSGLEEKMACDIFPTSDLEMINATIDDYIDEHKFMVYYATVSGHGEWGFGYNDMAEKNKDRVESLDYSDTVKAYIAANLELEDALASLVNKLEEAGKLDDTVIVLAADHHPYFMSNENVSEMAGKELDKFELYRNNLIIYNSNVKHAQINKVCNTIDVLPTTLNLFGIKYDSRLMVGKDILSNSDGLVIFADYSWISDKGRWDSITNTFTGEDVSDDYISNITSSVSNKYVVSKNILIYDYYKLIMND